MDVNSAKSAYQKLCAAARKDPQKAVILLVLVLVMAGLWAKTLIHSHPAVAGAAPAGKGAVAGSGGTGSDNLPAAKSATRGSWSTFKIEPVERNLFLVEYDRYPQAGKPAAAPGAVVQQSGDAAKSGPTPADLNKQRQILASNLQQQAAQLKLQSTLMGARPKAVVNGSLISEGDEIASFRVLKITARGMVIEREGIKLEVQMKQ